ncbi:cyclase family protein [Halorubellus sp. PRR65]|uniref:cyclase family protein n=1 Tax=Halorubellus sp. PRR65 TaxID=3098148 RepID=UPI002B2601B3|nr:cyclase family protein [Halorubellus sp. PRR65]
MTLSDLTHSVADGMPVYPGTTPVEFEQTTSVAEDGARAHVLTLQTHAGTHVDAPCHMREGASCLDAFAVDDFRFDAVAVDCTGHGARDPITVEDLPAASVAADADLLAFATGWSEHWGTDRYRDHPYLAGDAAAWCADHDCAVGVEGFSPDPTPSASPERERASEPDGYPAHDALFAGGQFIVENLAAVSALPESFVLHAYPLPLEGGDGCPVRAVAEH